MAEVARGPGVLGEPIRFAVDWGRRYTLWVFNVGLACCAVEFVAATTGRYDLARLGVVPYASGPAQADVLVVSGTVTDRMAPAIKRLYDELSGPRHVISFGACANSGGPYWDSYSVTKGVDQIIPVDVYIPGCPPRPEALLAGILKLQDRLTGPADCRCRRRRAHRTPRPEAGVTTPTAADVGASLAAQVGGIAGVSGGGRWARATVDVPPAAWAPAVTGARDSLGCDFFDWLSAVDEAEQGYRVVAHVWSTARRYGLLVRTLLPRSAPALASIVGLYPGAAWAERETFEMFGIDFTGHPGLAPLLLAPEFEGHPLRKDFVLASRVVKPWPGAVEPGESTAETGSGRRQPMRPPGVPGPGQWGP